jgi:Zn-dependent M28 family amino/carboxypeptidase
LTGFLFLAAGAGCRPAAAPVTAPPDDARAPRVQAPADLGSNALARVAQLAALGPRDAGTPGAARAADWIADQLRTIGLDVVRDTFEDDTPSGRRTFHNVLGRLPGAQAGPLLLLSHFDTKAGIAPDFIGANDGGSSTGLLLALAEWLARQPRRLGVEFAFLDGEECLYNYQANDGLHGSRRLARQLREESAPLRTVILLDMIGDHDLRFTVPRNSTSALKLLLLDATAAQGCRDRVTLLEYEILDDHQPFLDQGFPAIDLIDFDYGTRPGANDLWHTPGDTLDQLSAGSLQMTGAVTLEMMRRIEEQ